MNKSFLQAVFSETSGHVYKFLNTVPEGAEASHYITEQFIALAEDKSISTRVVELSQYGCTVVYSDHEIQPNQMFELVMDLVPDVIPEPVLVESPEIIPEEQ